MVSKYHSSTKGNNATWKKKSKSMTSARKEHNIRLEHFVVSESKEVSKNDENNK